MLDSLIHQFLPLLGTGNPASSPGCQPVAVLLGLIPTVCREAVPLPHSLTPRSNPLSLQDHKGMSALTSPTQVNIYITKEPLRCSTDPGDFSSLRGILLDQVVLQFGIGLDQIASISPLLRLWVHAHRDAG